MCGIAGFIDEQITREKAMQRIDSMCRVIRHRGPDDQGIWVGDDGVALGMRRLSIIDLSGGNQPIFNEDGSIVIVFNGEIYNYRDLRNELQARGHDFTTNSDTETIVHAYEEYGDECVTRLRGMFTFALWDRKRKRLLAARDRFGKKPLNYYWDGQRLIFGSEIKSILEANIPREVNPIALDEYLTYCYVPTPQTLFKSVFKVPAGHRLIYEDGQVSTKRYWELSFTPVCQDDEETAIQRTRELLREAVQVRLMSDVPLGAFLSGGVDSSVVVGLMSQMMSQPVKTFSIGFEEEDYSELGYARAVARHFGTAHTEFVVRPELVAVLPELVWAYDEPFADSSMLPTYYVSKLAREQVTVVLTGDGGDEIFGGYTRYGREMQVMGIPRWLRALLGYGGTLLPEGMRGKRRLNGLQFDLATRYAQLFGHFPVQTRAEMQGQGRRNAHPSESIYTREFQVLLGDVEPLQRMRQLFSTVEHLDTISQLQSVDVRAYLTDDILVKVDKASMFNSLETRAPLLDQRLAEYVASLPAAVRTPKGALKSLLKKAAVGLLPPEILSRPKQGFGVPLKHWFRRELNDFARELLDTPKARQRGIFEPQFVRHLLDAHASTRMINHSEAIWTLLCLELWFQTYMDTASTACSADVAAGVHAFSESARGR